MIRDLQLGAARALVNRPACINKFQRYRMVNKILVHVTKPWKTFRNDQPPNYVLQNILQHRFDQLFDPSGDLPQVKEDMAKKSSVPFDLLLKVD